MEQSVVDEGLTLRNVNTIVDPSTRRRGTRTRGCTPSNNLEPKEKVVHDGNMLQTGGALLGGGLFYRFRAQEWGIEPVRPVICVAHPAGEHSF